MSLVPDDELAKLVREEPAGARDRKESLEPAVVLY